MLTLRVSSNISYAILIGYIECINSGERRLSDLQYRLDTVSSSIINNETGLSSKITDLNIVGRRIAIIPVRLGIFDIVAL